MLSLGSKKTILNCLMVDNCFLGPKPELRIAVGVWQQSILRLKRLFVIGNLLRQRSVGESGVGMRGFELRNDVAGELVKRTFTLEYWNDDGWYVGKLREVPGVFSQGETVEELENNIRDAYQMVIEDSNDEKRADAKTKDISLEVG